MAKTKKKYLVKVLPSTLGTDSWARKHIGEHFVVQTYDLCESKYQVIENGEPTNRLLNKRHVEVINLTEPTSIEDFMANTLS